MIYYYSDGENKFGPFDFDELLKQPITRESLIWYEGLDKWIYAHEVDSLKDFFQLMPPPLDNNFIASNENPNVKRIRIVVGRKFIFWTIFIVLAIILVSKLAMKDDDEIIEEKEVTQKENTYKAPVLTKEEKEVYQKKQTILKETTNPLSFLSIEYKTSKAFLSKKNIVSGKITNSATETTYHNIKIKVKYFDKNKKELGSKEFPIDKTIQPKSDSKFKIKNRNPKGTESSVVSIIAAEIKLNDKN